MDINNFDTTIYDKIYVEPDALSEEKEEEYVFGRKEKIDKFKLKLKPLIPIVIVWTFWGLFLLFFIINIINSIKAIYELNLNYLNTNWFYVSLCTVGPVVLWVVQSGIDHFGVYMSRKRSTLAFTIFTFCLFLLQILLIISYHIFVPLIFKIPLSKDITATMVVNLARGVVAAFTIGLTIPIIYTLFKSILGNKELIEHFNIKKYFDFRRNKKFLYDAKYVRDINTGKLYTVKEADRVLHTLLDGTTGTAKTSGAMEPSIVGDLNQRVFNEDFIKKRIYKLVSSGDLSINTNFEEFNLKYFDGITPKGIKALKKLKKFWIAGLTLLAPNSALGDKMYEAAHVRGIKVNRIDPVLNEKGHHKPGFIGFNPLYIDPNKRGLDRRIEINAKACLFADVLQAVYDAGAKGDVYFTSVNRNVTTSVCITLMLTFEGFYGRQPNPSDVQHIIDDFSRIRKFYDAMKKIPDREDYSFVLDFVGFSMLGEGSKKMTEHATGLRLLLDELLVNPLFRSVLCAEKSIDLDKALREGEVTIVNYATELGMSQSMAFGLFFAFTFNNAVMRRPGTEKDRAPHFYYIDEFPVLLHPKFEQMFTYYRQFRVASCVCIQSIDQVLKNPSTAYFREVLIGNTAHKMFYGRMSPAEMELIETLGGTKEEIIEQKTTSETSLTTEDPSLTYSTREMSQTVARVNSTSAHYQKFMHVYFFTVDMGEPLPPFKGKVDFVPEYEKVGIERFKCDWSSFFNNNDETVKPIISKPVVTINVVENNEVLNNNEVENSEVIEGVRIFDSNSISDVPLFCDDVEKPSKQANNFFDL